MRGRQRQRWIHLKGRWWRGRNRMQFFFFFFFPDAEFNFLRFYSGVGKKVIMASLNTSGFHIPGGLKSWERIIFEVCGNTVDQDPLLFMVYLQSYSCLLTRVNHPIKVQVLLKKKKKKIRRKNKNEGERERGGHNWWLRMWAFSPRVCSGPDPPASTWNNHS